MHHKFQRRLTADPHFSIHWVDEVCVYCGKNKNFLRGDEQCPTLQGLGASIVGEKK